VDKFYLYWIEKIVNFVVVVGLVFVGEVKVLNHHHLLVENIL
jgi:hypothetical protein